MRSNVMRECSIVEKKNAVEDYALFLLCLEGKNKCRLLQRPFFKMLSNLI
jgi:hypothetical protein